MAASLDHRTQQMDGPPVDEEKIGGRVFCHSAHTRPSTRGEVSLFSCRKNHFFGGRKPRAPKPGEDPNRKQTEQGNPKETERPQVGSPRAKPQTRNKNNGEARFRVSEGNNPNQRKKRPRPCRRKGPRRQRGRRGAGHP